MGYPISARNKITVGNRTYTVVVDREPDSVVAVEKSGASALAAAKTGTLTTRTDANTGTLTMTTGHGITTGARLDVYWDGGHRRGMTVGTVATNSVPIDLGAGDDLPAATTEIVAMVPAMEAFAVVGDNAAVILCDAGAEALVTFTDGSAAELGAVHIEAGGEAYFADVAAGDTNVLAGDTVVRVYLSHADPAAAQAVRAAVYYN